MCFTRGKDSADSLNLFCCLVVQVVIVEGSDAELPQPQQSGLATINEALTRLNRLGVDIRESSRGGIHAKIQEFASRLDLLPVLDLSQSAVKCLYPTSHESLKAHLSKGMIDIYDRLRFLEHRQGRLETRRTVAPVPLMRPIKEGEPTGAGDQDLGRHIAKDPAGLAREVPPNRGFHSQSSLSTVDTGMMKGDS